MQLFTHKEVEQKVGKWKEIKKYHNKNIKVMKIQKICCKVKPKVMKISQIHKKKNISFIGSDNLTSLVQLYLHLTSSEIYQRIRSKRVNRI